MRSLEGQVCVRYVAICAVALATAWGCSMDGTFEGDPGDYGDGDGDADGDGDVDGDTDTDVDVEPEDPEDPEEPVEPECDLENPVVLYLSADDSNSMAGPVIARQAIRGGSWWNRPVRIYEFLNYYSFGYDAAEAGAVRVSAQMRPSAADLTPEDSADQHFDLQIGVRAPDVALAERRPLNITLSLDTSGSMSGEPIELIRQSCLALAHSMGEGDVVSMVTWNDRQEIILDSHAIAGPDDEELVAACRQLDATGTTDLHSGLVLAYELARRNFNHERINRVILMSDGGANTGITDIDLIAQNADDAEGEAIYMMGVGMASPGSYQDGLMDAVTDAGKGAYIYIDSAEEAQLMFGERLLSNVEIAARDVRVELTLPPTFSMAEFHGEEYSEDPEEVEPQHLAPNDAMIYHQIVRSCDQSSLDMGTAITVRATYETPFTREPLDATLETNLGTLLTGDDALLVKGNAVVAYAQALADRSLAASALDQVQAAIEVLGADPDLLEIEELLTLLGGNGD